MQHDLEQYWRELQFVVRSLSVEAVARLAEWVEECHRAGGTVYVLGNGGSAATASHFACDLAKGTRVEGVPPVRVVALTDNMALLTAWGNDEGYDRVFAEQVASLVRPGDLVLLISVSGNSPNVLAVPKPARRAGARTVALTGGHGGRLRQLVDLAVTVPRGSIEQVEDMHLAIAHSVCVALRQRFRRQADGEVPAETALYERPTEAIAVNGGD